ncbi:MULTISPECIES: phosphoribosylamine--glycine ligase [unclassified Halanaerobium]|uniref:phosphoribosylamine--glycine ligase n=1 Tax=unclassified Halanaerobium TaxID=2641197 RepID=UPI000DF3D978|nr:MULTISPECIES: phosphoribosylamine--glycine ligase [unclassified Halanaerobium]RCW44118.1 phosphoribosylamine--glycine ligase [Halanaerobium sp. MA284_MarDTE_T2]RCW86976.1 phosphoribosylamine--glycine ligase [Halanaerobium sp. DL-01]
MKVLVVGSGGREHALVWKIFQSERVEEIYAAPGNDGMSELASLVDIAADDIEQLADFAEENKIDLTVVGPEEPLVAGIVDYFEERGLKIFGPKKQAALLEGSKVYAKNILKKYNIPTAEFEIFTDPDSALDYLKNADYPIVIKAEGLARGKGVILAHNFESAQDAVERIMEDKVFGDAGDRIVVEDFLQGEEVSVFALSDGETMLPFSTARDHKAVFDGDEGPNTGGMGAYSPSPFVDERIMVEICEKILLPTFAAFEAENIEYKGVLFVGIILTEQGPKVLDYNARFGDPETQVILPRLKEDLIDLLEMVIEGKLDKKEKIEFDSKAAACVVLCSAGYPLTYIGGKEIKGIDRLKHFDDLLLFHAGTRLENGKFITDGGRVLNLTVLTEGLFLAVDKVYQYIEEVEFEDMHYRTDIGFTAMQLKREG